MISVENDETRVSERERETAAAQRELCSSQRAFTITALYNELI